MKVGLFGGSFDPVHNSHIRIAQGAKTQLRLDEIWFLPVFHPVHKSNPDLAPFDFRVQMLEQTVSCFDGFHVKCVEKDLEGASYTIRTVRHLKKKFPHVKFSLLIGGDSLIDLPTWKDYRDLLREISLGVVARPGFQTQRNLPGKSDKWILLPPEKTSSSEIRDLISRGRWKGLPLPSGAVPTIVSENIYHCHDPKFFEIIKLCRRKAEKLPGYLREHIREVAILAARFAFELGSDPREGYLAGSAHDLYRSASNDKILRFVQSSGFKITALESRNPMLAHGLAASGFLASLQYKVPDSILRAVRWHTRPRTKASLTGKALVLADTLEPLRKNPALQPIRDAKIDHHARYLRVLEYKRAKGPLKHRHPGDLRAHRHSWTTAASKS